MQFALFGGQVRPARMERLNRFERLMAMSGSPGKITSLGQKDHYPTFCLNINPMTLTYFVHNDKIVNILNH
jgi:hypothetical protein